MGNLYRFVEPIVLFLLKKKGASYGYDLSADFEKYALTDAATERAALYRTLRQLEKAGNVTSQWEVEKSGPARRISRLTPKGGRHLDEWVIVLGHVSQSMARFVAEAHRTNTRKRAASASRS